MNPIPMQARLMTENEFIELSDSRFFEDLLRLPYLKWKKNWFLNSNLENAVNYVCVSQKHKLCTCTPIAVLKETEKFSIRAVLNIPNLYDCGYDVGDTFELNGIKLVAINEQAALAYEEDIYCDFSSAATTSSIMRRIQNCLKDWFLKHFRMKFFSKGYIIPNNIIFEEASLLTYTDYAWATGALSEMIEDVFLDSAWMKDGFVLKKGIRIARALNKAAYVIPVLRIRFLSTEWNVGDYCDIQVSDSKTIKCRIVALDTAIVCSAIGYVPFDKEERMYHHSDVKCYIDNWFDINIKNKPVINKTTRKSESFILSDISAPTIGLMKGLTYCLNIDNDIWTRTISTKHSDSLWCYNPQAQKSILKMPNKGETSVVIATVSINAKGLNAQINDFVSIGNVVFRIIYLTKETFSEPAKFILLAENEMLGLTQYSEDNTLFPTMYEHSIVQDLINNWFVYNVMENGSTVIHSY